MPFNIVQSTVCKVEQLLPYGLTVIIDDSCRSLWESNSDHQLRFCQINHCVESSKLCGSITVEFFSQSVIIVISLSKIRDRDWSYMRHVICAK